MSEINLVQDENGYWYDSNGKRVWRAGTLVYDRKKLIRVFFWLLFGNFTYTIFTTGIPMMLPIQFEKSGFDSSKIAWLMGLMALGSMLVCPAIGMWSDRFRSRWGRRRPFDLVTTPIWLIGLVLLPYAKTFLLANIAMILIGFAGAATVVVIYLYNDVIPGELLGRFTGMIRFVGFGGGLIFQYVMFPYFDKYPKIIFLTCAIIAFVCEMLMLVMVKEGDYPPPERKQSILHDILLFCKEGLGSRYMIFFLLSMGVVGLASPASSFAILFFKSDELNMTTRDIGYMMGTGTILAMMITIPAGWLVDKIGPRLIWGTSAFFMGIFNILTYFFVVDKVTAWTFTLISNSLSIVLMAALLPMLFYHLPKEKFGQLTSCQSLVSWGMIFFSNLVLGTILNSMNNYYRLAFIYAGCLFCLAPIFLYLLKKSPNPFGDMEITMRKKKTIQKDNIVDTECLCINEA